MELTKLRIRSRLLVIAVAGCALIAITGTPAIAVAVPPTASIPAGADGWVNAAEAPALQVSGTYQTGVGITHIRVDIGTDAGATCSAGSLTPVVDLPVDGSGTWSTTFNVAAVAEGTKLCAKARSFDGLIYSTLSYSPERPELDTIAPGTGTLTLDHGGDGIINAGEAQAQPATSWTAGAGSTQAILRFTDIAGVIPVAACGPYVAQATETGTLSTSCSNAFPDGPIQLRGRWIDAAANSSAEIIVGATLDRQAAGAGTVEMLDPNGDGYMNLAEATTSCCIPANWSNTHPDVVMTEVFFVDTAGIKPGCGPWSVSPSGSGSVNAVCAANMNQGLFTFGARWYDAANNVSQASTSLIKDTLLPTPVILEPGAGDVVPRVFTVIGETEPGATVNYKVNGVLQSGDEIAWDGGFRRTFTLPGGVYTIEVIATDRASNVDSASISLTVDPLIPLIETPEHLDITPRLTEITGTCNPDSYVEIWEGTQILVTADCSADGVFENVVGLTSGQHTIRARGVQGANTSTFGPERTFFADPGPPSLTITTQDLTINPLQVKGLASDETGVMRIQLEYFDAIRGVKLARATADCFDCGPGETASQWLHKVPTDLAPGLVRVEATAYNRAGNASNVEAITFLYVHDL